MGRLNRHLCEFVEQENRGRVYLFCSYQIGANERIIDLSFISTARIPPEGEPDTKWMTAPDLAVEIISHTDLYCDVYRRLTDYLNANVKQVWLVNPSDHSVMIYRSYADITVFTDDAEWTCEDLLSGFRLPLHKVFNPS